ncbi:cupin domain-containing protein [Marimonas arenosa]|uniref:Cupin domain-containing protein n=1 Tax=Marimonas arenosa TaxID=1795305 RepID=A0AAE3WI96_9RHOB|nr:cupin domain-containing protein [Marimonas arenosa]MDQ2092023.1 cupin domain-containing protein [Marimonas arenosa]
MDDSDRVLFHVDDPSGGIARKLAEGLTTTIFPGEHAMISVVRIAPGAEGQRHSHPEEQWGLLLQGSATRYQGDHSFELCPGNIWRTPPGVEHTIKAGPDGAVVIDVFAPIREAYLKPGEGFGES